jgi:hypothetical protein
MDIQVIENLNIETKARRKRMNAFLARLDATAKYNPQTDPDFEIVTKNIQSPTVTESK